MKRQDFIEGWWYLCGKYPSWIFRFNSWSDYDRMDVTTFNIEDKRFGSMKFYTKPLWESGQSLPYEYLKLIPRGVSLPTQPEIILPLLYN